MGSKMIRKVTQKSGRKMDMHMGSRSNNNIDSIMWDENEKERWELRLFVR